MFRPIARAFASRNTPTSFSVTGAFDRLKKTLRAPVKHFKRTVEPTAADYNPWTNTTQEAFDEVSQEWQALIVGNSFDVNTMNMLEQSMIMNFGTVDNPHVIFTSDAPFRYVGCTGQMNEDDYEGHEFLIFMLREGPLQRCPSCGQVYKLVRLRNEFSPEMDYYLPNLIPYQMEEMGEMDTVINMSVLRMQKDTYEYTQFETPSKTVYNLVNPDEHDRLLTDPAYRLERSKKLEEKLYVYIYSLQEIEKEYVQNHGPAPRYPVNKVDYETLIDVEKAILKMDRVFRKVDKFNNRKYVDRDNHARRERRMKERAQDRWQQNYTIFFGGLTEEEQKYRDYFETDLENNPEEEEIEQKLDEDEVLGDGNYKFDKYDFQELYTRLPEDDASSYLEKKAFKFKYRAANDSAETYARRQRRMINRQLDRFEAKNVRGIVSALSDAIEANQEADRITLERQYLDIVASEAIAQYQDYYESDKEEDFSTFDSMAESDKVIFMNVFENHAVPRLETKGFGIIEKRAWDPSLGFWNNFYYSMKNYAINVVPRATELTNQAERAAVSPLSKQELQELGLLEGLGQERIEEPDRTRQVDQTASKDRKRIGKENANNSQ